MRTQPMSHICVDPGLEGWYVQISTPRSSVSEPTEKLAQAIEHLDRPLGRIPIAESRPPDTSLRIRAILVVAALAVIGWLVSNRIDKLREERRLAQEHAASQKRLAEISRFAASLGAVEVKSSDLHQATYSAEFDPILVRSDGRPVLLAGLLKQVTKADDQYSITVEANPRLMVTLQANPDLATRLMSLREPDKAVALVAKIARVTGGSQTNSDGESVSIAEGRLVDFRHIDLGDWFDLAYGDYLSGDKKH